MTRRFEDLAEEHRRISAMARRIKDTEIRDLLAPLLPDFCTMLEQHFAVEEAPGGLFEILRMTAPERGREVDELAQQHRAMLSETRTLLERARKEGRQSDGEIVEEAHRIAAALGEHEAAENVLLLDVFNTDVGASD